MIVKVSHCFYRFRFLGFQLLELMCCLTIIALLVCLAVPTSQSWRAQAKVKRVSQEIAHAIRYAHHLALLTDSTLILSPKTEQDWSSGMVLFQLFQCKRAIIYTWIWNIPNIKINWVGFDRRNQIKFSNTLQDGNYNGYFLVELGAYHQKIVLNRLGRMIERNNHEKATSYRV